MTTYFKSDGSKITIGQKLGQGGEGAVFEIKEEASVVAKIYHGTVPFEQITKLEAMISLKTEDLLRISSWPIDTIHKTKGGDVVGLVMPRITGYKPVHELYSPKSRRTEFPAADWRFLINTATNISRAFGIIHNYDHIIGDVNHGNLVVAADGTVKLIDCDSFQVYSGNKYHFCTVGVPEYTPPELASSNFANTIRTQNHDLFGLAVLNFHLLFLGRHPFAGKYLGSGYMPIDRAIKENRFVYGVDSRSKMMEPPPNTLPLNSTTNEIVKLFESAFNPNSLFHARPSAKEWVLSLTDLSKQLKPCYKSSSHFYFEGLANCPWCSFEKKLGIDFFQTQKYSPLQSFNIDLVWPRIQQLKRPGFFQIQEIYKIDNPSPDAKKIGLKFRYKGIMYVASVLAGLVIGLGLTFLLKGLGINLNTMFAPIILISLAMPRILVPKKKGALNKFEQHLSKVEGQCELIMEKLNTPLREFDIELAELKSLKAEHQNLPIERAKGFESLKNNIKENQLIRFLEKFEINNAVIKSIGEGRKQMLMSFSVETAADITQKQVSAVPGFGPAMVKILLDWRKECEKGFVFDYNKGIDPQDIAKLDKKVNDKKFQIEGRLGGGAKKLQGLLDDFYKLKELKAKEIDDLTFLYQQAKYDLAYLKKL